VILKDGAAVDPPQDDMVKGTGRVDSGFTGNDSCLELYPLKINLSSSSPTSVPNFKGLADNHSLCKAFWTRHGTDHFLGPAHAAKGRISIFIRNATALIQMGDWCGSA